MSKPRFRVIDTGLRKGQENIAFDQAMIDAHRAGEIPNTIRFIHFKPVALVGRHQIVEQEVREEFCHDNDIDIGRRITGGGAIYLDPGQMGWAIICDRKLIGDGSLGSITAEICTAAAKGLSKLGLEANFRPRNDIEVKGRKISGTGGFFDGNTLIYQGTVLGQVDPAKMFGALNVASDKLSKRGLEDASKRVTTLHEELGHLPDWEEVKAALVEGFSKYLGIDVDWGAVSETEELRCRALYTEEIGTKDFIYDLQDNSRDKQVRTGQHQSTGGMVKAHVRLEGAQNERLREVLLSGDFFVTPPRIIYDLEAHLRRAKVEEIDEAIAAFFKTHEVGMLSVTPQDFAIAIKNALGGT